MKQTFLWFAFLLCTSDCLAQDKEFPESYDGFVYADSTIRQLKFIVDSLNLKFRVCELNRVYLSKAQSKAHFVQLRTENVPAAMRDMEAGITFDDFVKKYPAATFEKELLVLKIKSRDYEDNPMVEFSSIQLAGKYDHDLYFYKNLHEFDRPLLGKWLFKHRAKTKYSEETIDAFYFLEEFVQRPLPEQYARMIQYSDCMVDTSVQIFLGKYEDRWSDKRSPDLIKFMEYVHAATKKPVFVNGDSKGFVDRHQAWDSLRMIRLDSLKKVDPDFTRLLQKAVAAALNSGDSDDEFEEYVHRYASPKTALELKRSRWVVGSCSQDDSPRRHALNIARLSAETVNWEIFLRSHLDVMNDRFERMSDGSYAQAGRKTYIRELEVLDINVPDLLLGISFRIENPSTNHYYGSIGRLGRALSESANPELIEAQMLQIITDDQLDDYNRLLIYYLFLNYNHHLEDKEKQKANQRRLDYAVQALPGYLADKLVAGE